MRMFLISGLVALAAVFAAPAMPALAASALLGDAPALGDPGPLTVGFSRIILTHTAQPDLLTLNPATGAVKTTDRALPLAIWYPAKSTLTPGTPRPKPACYKMATPVFGGVDPKTLPSTMGDCGRALEDARPLAGPYPLVVLSHGFMNWATAFSQLAENLASRGYVVVSIDHRDLAVAGPVTGQVSFAVTVATRAADQRFVLDTFARRDGRVPAWLAPLYDPARMALAGYSMGGFGAIATMGGGYTAGGGLDKMIPASGLAGFTEGTASFETGVPPQVKALVLFAPWGGAPAVRAWTPQALASVTVPVLMIDGDQDDIVDYAKGARWIFDSLSGADRHLLVYQNARHNIALNPADSQVASNFVYRDRHDEPVWRADRLQAINAHFVTAFLDAQLKDDTAHAAYLSVPTVKAVDSQWPGFQPRWGMGLELHSKKAGQ
jgi:predicted dienelactone hydrolase